MKVLTRRSLLRRTTQLAASTIAAPYIVPSSALGSDGSTAPSEQLTMGGIGIGNQGMHNLRSFLTCDDLRVLAVCDVDTKHRIRAKNTVDSAYGNKDCSAYNDFREILVRDDLDTVLIATPDHWHAILSIEAAKAGKDVRFVGLDEFNALCQGDEVLLTASPNVVMQRTELKNRINRLTGTTASFEIEGEEVGGTLFDRQELAYVDRSDLLPKPVDVSIYVKVADEESAEKAEDLFRRLARSGYGAKKAVGYGQFKVVEFERFDGFAELDGANGFVSLSNWVPARDDPRLGFYNTLVKYGKLGEELAVSENPFKFPLTMLTAGSSFYAEGEVTDYYGRLVEGIAPAADEVVQYGYAFAIPARLLMEDGP